MINPKNKRVMITLTEESTQLLESLSTRYNKTKTEIIKWALNVLAAKKKHNVVINLREQLPSNPEEQEIKEYKNYEDDPELQWIKGR